MLNTLSNKRAMIPPFLRVPAISNRLLSQLETRRSLESLACQTQNLWICERCSQRKFFSTRVRRAQVHLRRPIARPPYPEIPTARASSTFNDLQDASKPRSELPSQEEDRRSHTSKRFDHLMDSLQSNIFIAGRRLNDLTGYSGIETLKNHIEKQEIFVQETRSALQHARDAYAKAISQRSTSQREVNELLQRKHAWTPTDLERFTELYRSDHTNEQAEATAQTQVVNAEKIAEEAAAQLSKSILARYHEEQIWSDKIRRMSTWGTWGLMGMNVLLFLVFQVAVEPWRRKRLVRGFEEKVKEALEKEPPGYGHNLRKGQTDEDAATIGAVIADSVNEVGPTLDTKMPISDTALEVAIEKGSSEVTVMDAPSEVAGQHVTSTNLTFRRIKEKAQDLFSNRQVSLRQIDLTAVALGGAAAGVVVAGSIVILLRPQ